MNDESRLAQIVADLEAVDLQVLVMGGHAVRYYGLNRNTNDFDLCLAPDNWNELGERLSRADVFAGKPLVEGPSWRPSAFRRYEIGRLADGREEWLEFWNYNHLLSPYAELAARREVGEYGGRAVPFLSLPDLIRSKETERDRDWADVAILEEFLDARNFAKFRSGQMPADSALAQLHSRRGLESFYFAGLMEDMCAVAQALSQATTIKTVALLLPFAPQAAIRKLPHPLETAVTNRLQLVAPVSGLHWALIAIARKQYQRHAKAIDRADKESIRAPARQAEFGD